MHTRVLGLSLALAALVVALTTAQTREPIQPVRPAVVGSAAMVELGKQLYFDPRLSKSGFISCNSCHNLSMAANDHRREQLLPTKSDHSCC